MFEAISEPVQAKIVKYYSSEQDNFQFLLASDAKNDKNSEYMTS